MRRETHHIHTGRPMKPQMSFITGIAEYVDTATEEGINCMRCNRGIGEHEGCFRNTDWRERTEADREYGRRH
jgi:hypothetical protein